MANRGRFEYTIGFKTDESGLKKAKEELEKIQKLTINSSELKIDLKPGEAEIYAANIQNAKDSALQLYNALQNATKANGQFSATSFIGQLKTLNLKEIYNNMAKLGPVGTQAFRSMADQALKLNTYVKQSNTILTKFGNTLYRNLEWLISGNLINSVTGIFTKAYGFTKNLDSSLNDIRIVTGKSADEMERFGREAQQTALELSKGTTDITNASLIFYQQGLDQEEVNARTEVTAKMSNVTGQSAETIADQMTAVWNGFQVGSEELEHYADVMTAVAASTASSSAELAGAISKVSSIANTTGVDMEQLTAMISTVISVTRDSPETVGTAFKTIFARMDDLVEDGTDEFGVTLGRVSSHLAAMGIEILDEDGKLRDLGDTLTETGEKWSSYSREQQVAIAEQMGGKRQWNQVLALFDNWDKYSQALDVARDSTGALQEQQDTFSERVEAHLQQLKTQWDGVYQDLLRSKEILAIVDAGKNLLSVLETIVKTAGGAVPILGSVASIMLGAFSDKVAQQIIRIKNNLILMAEAASDAALKTKVAKEFGAAANPNDKAFQAQIAYYKVAGQMTATMTEEERKRINALGEASTQKAKEIQKLVEEKEVLDEVAKKWGNIKEYQDLNNLNLEELKEKTAAINEEAKEAAQAFENWRTNEDFTVETLTGSQTPNLTMTSSKSKTYAPESGKVAFKPSGSAGITKEEQQALVEANSAAEKYQHALDNLKEKQDRYNEAVQNGETGLERHLQQLAGAQDGYRLATEELQKASQGLEQFDNLTEESKQNLQSINSINLSDSFNGFDQLNEKFQELQTQGLLSEQSIEEISAKLKTIDKTDTLQLADAWELLKQKLQESKRDFKTLSDGALNQTVQKLKQARAEAISLSQQKIQSLEEAQFSKATQGLTQMTSAVGQLGFGLQSLSNAWKTLNNDEATGLEKFTAMTMAITQVGHATKTAINGLDNFLSAIILDNKAIDENVRIENEAIRQSEESQALKMAEAEQNERNAAIIGVENAEKEINNNETEEEIINGTLNNGLKATEANERGVNTGAIVAETDAQMVQNGINAVARTGQALTLANLKAIIAARLAHIAALIKETALLIAAHAPIAILIAAFGVLAWGIAQVVKARKEEKEAFQRTTAAAEELKKKNVELRATIENNIKAFNDFEKVWENFQKGIATIDEVKNAFQTMAEQLGVAENEEYQRLMRIANYTKDYAPLEEYLDKIIEKQRQVATGTYSQDADANRKLLDTTIEDFNPSKRNKYGTGTMIHGMAANQAGAYIKDEGIEDILIKTGIAKNVTHGGFEFTIETGEINEKALEQLLQYREKFEEMKNSENKYLQQVGTYYIDLMDRVAGTIDAIQESDIQAMAAQRVSDFQLLKGKDEKEKQQDFRKQLNELEKQGQNEFFQQHGKKMTDEQKKQLHDTILSEYAKAFPKNEEFVAKIETEDSLGIEEIFKQAAKDAQKGKDPLLASTKELKELSVSELNKIKETLENNDIDFSMIDMQTLAADSDFLAKIISQRGQLEQEDIEKFKKYQIQTGEIAQYLSQDYNALSDTFENFNSKVKKGTFDTKTFNSKAFQEFFTDDVKDELTELYGATSDVGQAIQTLSNEAIVGSEEWEQAWEVFGTALDNAEITQDVQNAQEALDQLNKHVKELDDGEVHIFAGVSVEEAEEEIDNFVNAQRTIDIDISVKAESKTDAVKDTLKDVQELGSKIDENLQLSFEDFIELEQQFPKIGEGMQILADGTIQLSQTAVDEARKQQKENIATAVDEQIAKIEIEKVLLEEKKKKYEEAAEEAKKFAQKAANGEYETDQLQTDLDTLQEYYNDIQDISDRQERAEELQLQKDQIEDWKKYYDGVTELDAAYNKQRIKNAMAVTEEEVKSEPESETPKASSFYKLTSGDIWNKAESRFTTMTYSELAAAAVANKKKPELDNMAIEEYWNGIADSMTQGANNAQKSLDALDETEGKLNRIKQMYSNQTSLWGKATKENTDATKANADAQQELCDLLNEEIDAYHDINVEIERNTTALNRLQKAQEKASGKSLIKNLEDQIKAYNELNQSLEEKQGLNYTKAIAYRVQLENQGITFNEDGTIANYNERLRQEMASINADLEWYNNLGGEEQESYKDWIDGRTKELDDLKELISNYETLWNKEIPDLADEIAENVDKQVELQLEIETAKIKIVVDEGSLKRTELEISKIKNHLQDTNILGNLTYDAQVLFSYRDSGEEKALKDRYEKLKAVVDEARMKGAEIDQRILDSFKTAQDEYLKYIQEAAERTVKIVTDVFDRLDKRIERQKTQIETINKIFEHDMNLVKLRYGDSAYQQLTTLYEARERVSKVQLQNAQVRIQAIQQALQQARENNLGDDVIQQYEDQLASALESQRQAIDDYLNLVKEKATNAIDEVFAHLDEQLAGTSLEEVKIEWDWTNKDTDDYYDTINAAYELEKLRNQMRKAINETDDVATQKALNDLMNDELEQLQQKDKLSKYDIERANALFDIEQKRAAFREAQNNKSKMRLRRDSSGNYSYQFVSDEDRVTSAMQDLADAQNSLYNIDKEAYKNNLDKMYEYYEEFAQKMKEAAANGATEEELLKIQEKYATRLGDLQQDLYKKANNLEQVALDERQRMTGESWEELAVIERNVLMGDIVPTWNTALATMMQHPDLQKFLQIASAEAIDIAQGATSTVEATIQTNIGTSLEDLVNGADPAVDAISRMTESVVSLETELSRLVTILSSMSGITLEGGEVLQDITNSGKQYADGIVGLTTGNQTALDNTLQTVVQGWTNLISQAHQDTTETTGRAIGATAIHRREYPDTTQARIDYLKMVEQYKENIQNLVKALNLNEPIAAINSRIAAINKTNSQTVQPSYITNNIQAEFPAVNSAQEIQTALEMLMNQATQSAFNTLK